MSNVRSPSPAARSTIVAPSQATSPELRTARSFAMTPEPLAQNLARAQLRLSDFFSDAPRHQQEADRAAATTLIEQELAANGDNVAEDVKATMVDLLSLMLHVDRALDFKRGNTIVRKDDGGVDLASTFENGRLNEIAQQSYTKVENPRGERPIQLSTKLSAIGLLTGTASCVTYVHMFALRLALHCSESDTLRGKFKMKIHSMPRPEPEANRLDHVYGTLAFESEDGSAHTLVFDPWADKHRIMLERHSTFTGAFSEESKLVSLVDAGTAELVSEHMRVANENLPSVHAGPLYAARVAETEKLAIGKLGERANFDLRSTLAGFVDLPADNARPGTLGPIMRLREPRPTHESALFADA